MPNVRWKDKTVISPDDDQDRIPITDDTDSSDKYTTATRILGDGLKTVKDAALTPDAYGMSFLELTSDTEAQQLINVEPGVDVATAAQGALADSALQGDDIGVSVQGYNALLAGLAAQSPVADGNLLFASGANTFEKIAVAADIETLLKAASLDDGNVVAKTGTQTIAGLKTLSNLLTLSAGLTFGQGTLSYFNEQQTWTPTVYGSTTAGSHTYAIQQGAWARIGKQVICHFYIDISSLDAAMAGNVYIGGLPFTSRNSTGHRTAAAFSLIRNLAFTDMITGRIAGNENFVRLNDITKGLTGAPSATTASQIGANLALQGSIFYEAA